MSRSGDFVTGFHEERTEAPWPHPIIGAYTSARQAALGKAEYNERWAARDPEHAAEHLHAARAFRGMP